MDNYDEKFKEYSHRTSQAYKWYMAEVGKATDKYFMHMAQASTIPIEEYIHSLNRAAEEFRRRLDELRIEFKMVLI